MALSGVFLLTCHGKIFKQCFQFTILIMLLNKSIDLCKNLGWYKHFACKNACMEQTVNNFSGLCELSLGLINLQHRITLIRLIQLQVGRLGSLFHQHSSQYNKGGTSVSMDQTSLIPKYTF